MTETAHKNLRILVIIAVILAALTLTAWLTARVTQTQATVHHHANVAIYIDGERLDLTDNRFMEDTGACKPNRQQQARDRVHLHENNMDTVHVHDGGVTWGHFLTNLGFYYTPDTIVLDDGTVIANTDTQKWHVVLNGKKIVQPFAKHIASHDRMLLSFGEGDEEILQEQYNSVSDDAGTFNEKYDPGACQADVKQNIIVKTIVEMLGKSHKHGE